MLQQSEEIRAQSDRIQEQNDRLHKAYEELKELGQFKDSMTGMIVHDLKNPLSVILGFSDLPNLEDRRAPLRAAARQMQILTMNMLDVQKFESAGVNLQLREIPAREVVAQALEQVAFLAAEKQIVLRDEADAALVLKADEEYLVRLLVNLLNNAVKFAPLNGEIRLEGRAKANGLAELAVTDNGPGIPVDKLDSVFDKFSKLDDPSGRNKKGTGLGLTFCKMTAEAHGGAIRAENAETGGARFVVELPGAEISEQSVAPKAVEVEPAKTKAVAFSEADQAAVAPVAAKMREIDIYEISELTDALDELADAKSEAVQNWRRRAENAIFSMNEAALQQMLDEAEAV